MYLLKAFLPEHSTRILHKVKKLLHRFLLPSTYIITHGTQLTMYTCLHKMGFSSICGFHCMKQVFGCDKVGSDHLRPIVLTDSVTACFGPTSTIGPVLNSNALSNSDLLCMFSSSPYFQPPRSEKFFDLLTYYQPTNQQLQDNGTTYSSIRSCSLGTIWTSITAPFNCNWLYYSYSNPLTIINRAKPFKFIWHY
jgi:hypothetical protein